jgi:hypothetical protein
MKSKTISCVIAMLLLSFPLLVNAQGDPGGDPDVPIDGGLSILLGAGVGYVVKKGFDRKKRKNPDNL